MTLTLPFFREAPLPCVLQKTDPAQLLCRSPPHGQRRCASTGRSRTRPILRQVQRLPLFCAAPEGGVAGIILNKKDFPFPRGLCQKPAADVSPPRHRPPPAMPPSQRLPALITPPTSVSGHGLRTGGRSGFHVPLLPPFQIFRSSRTPPREKSRNSQSRGNKPRRAAFGQKKSPARGRAT